MQYYLKSTQKAAIHALKTGDTSLSDEIHKHNEGILRSLFQMLVDGEIDVFYTKSPKSMTVWHRSTREGVKVQESHIWLKDGGEIPLSHADLNSPEELLEHHGYTVGAYYRTA